MLGLSNFLKRFLNKLQVCGRIGATDLIAILLRSIFRIRIVRYVQSIETETVLKVSQTPYLMKPEQTQLLVEDIPIRKHLPPPHLHLPA
mmetsp:Transcript_13878/g.15947  ORF Transcript_13878/g.15947 Transcript_13878/m.15947 type:complete len:89 (+) Transcript_13878:174-440(+)